MSFGFSNRVPDIDAAITLAVQHNVVLLAAASNCGGNARVSWPARDDRIFCIYASTGIGNKYPRNPAATRARHNFAVLGTAVKALWPRQEDMVRKSGTSTATPICAAIVAVIISVLRRSENKYIAAHRRVNQNDLSIDELRNSYRAKLEVLGRHSTIASILHLMVAEGNNRDGYDYITPWHLFNKERGAVAIIEDMLTAIDA
jgi:subtilisin family serine protease